MSGVGRRSRTISGPHPLRGTGGRENTKSCSFKASTVAPGGVDEVQSITLTGSPSGGNWTATHRGQTTANIAYNAAASAVEDALEALSTIKAGNVRVTGSAGGPYTVTFLNDLGNRNLDQLTANGSGLTGGTTPGVTVATVTHGSSENAGLLAVRRGTIIMAVPGNAAKATYWNGNSATDILGVLAQDYEWLDPDDRNDADLSYWGGPNCDFLAKNLTGYAGHESNFKTWAASHGCVVTEGAI